MSDVEYRSAFHATADTLEEAEDNVAQAALMVAIEQIIATNGWTVKQAAERFGVSQRRITDLLRHRFDRFSLVDIAEIIGTLVAHTRSSKN